mmetsp:Transcript_37875/g.57953  ORF Transcript_37875/g.57953 Transcript_37875/m.57953 type:complete len:200 (+) Transcript_37875:1-600(+)
MKVKSALCALALVLLADQASAVTLRARLHDEAELPAGDENVAVENIYGIPSDKEKSLMQAKKFAKQKVAKLAKKKQDFKSAFAAFSKSLEEEDFDRAMKLKNDLIENDNVNKEELDKIKINTNALFKKQFMFPEVAKNDFATELFESLEIQEKNLNSNLENVDLFNSFVEEAEKVKKALKDKYADQWTDPAEGKPQALN